MNHRWAMTSYLAGATTARAGDSMAGPALALAGLAATGSASDASVLAASLTAAAAIGGPVFGALLDRSGAPGRLLAAALASYAAGLALILITLGRLPFGYPVSIALVGGLFGLAIAGGWTSQLPRVAAFDTVRGGLPRANALDAMTFDGAALVAPALAGMVADLAGAGAAVALSLTFIVASAPAAWTLPTPRAAHARTQRTQRTPHTPHTPHTPGEYPAAPDDRSRPHASLRADLGAGLRTIARNGPLARATAVSVLSCVGEGMLLLCFPLLGKQILGGAGHGALLLSATAAAGLAANAILSARSEPATRTAPDAVLWISTLILAAAMALAATCAPIPVIGAAILAGIGSGPQLTALFAIRHREAPDRVRGQVFTTGASLKITGYAIGAGITGPIATWSLSAAPLTAAGIELLAAAAYVLLTRNDAGKPISSQSRPQAQPAAPQGTVRESP